MAVISVRETFDGRDGQPVGPIASLFKNRQWKITTDGSGDTDSTIYAQCKPGGTGGASGTSGTLPAMFSAHPENTFFTCRSLTIEPFAQKVAWMARATYSAAPLSESEKEEQERQTYPNPCDRPPKITRSTKLQPVYKSTTTSGKALLNSAGDPYPAQQRSIRIPTYKIKQNVPNVNDEWETLIDSVNENTFTISDGLQSIEIPEKQGLIADCDIGELNEENGFPFYVLSCTIQRAFDDMFWQLSLADEGFHYLDGTTKKRIMIEGDDGIPVEPAETQLLDGNGAVLLDGQDPFFNDFDDWRAAKSWAPFTFGSE